MSEWRPIETAPGEPVIVWNGRRVTVGERWEPSEVAPGLECQIGWHDIVDPGYSDPAMEPQPTHWMPLPEPPVSDANEAAHG